MNLKELYDQTPVARHPEIVLSGDRLFFDREEYLIDGAGELRLVRSQKDLEQRLARIETNGRFQWTDWRCHYDHRLSRDASC